MAKILDVETSVLKEKLVVAMAKMASQGSVPAAQAAVKMIDEIELSEAANEHFEKIEELKKHPGKLCYYLGRIGESKSDIDRHLGRKPSEEEVELFKTGAKDRRLEIRAIELDQVKRGGKVEDWMKR